MALYSDWTLLNSAQQNKDEQNHDDQAQSARDLGLFWGLAKHMRGARSIASEDGSGGGITGTLTELVDLARELMGKNLGDDEPLLRARFLDYLRS